MPKPNKMEIKVFNRINEEKSINYKSKPAVNQLPLSKFFVPEKMD